MVKEKYSTGTASEKRVGYSRAIKVGDKLYFSGTTSQDENGNAVGNTVYDQTKSILDKTIQVAKQAGFFPEDVVLIRAYLVDMNQISEFDRAFSARFKDINPCCTLVGISALIDPQLLIEIETMFEK